MKVIIFIVIIADLIHVCNQNILYMLLYLYVAHNLANPQYYVHLIFRKAQENYQYQNAKVKQMAILVKLDYFS